MRMSSSHCTLLIFRCRSIIWVVLVALLWSVVPAVSLAQQSTAQIASLKGVVLVNGQPGAQGVILRAGDVIETQANATAVLQLSDGSQIEVGESTQLDLAELFTTGPAARTSRLKVVWGWVRAKLSPDYNNSPDAKFEIETPNALVGVKFSPPDTKVSYEPSSDPQQAKTVATGFTNQLDVLNKITGERIVSKIGETVTITAAGIIVAGAAGALSAKTLAIGAGAVAAAGGIAVLASGSDGGGEKNFTGRFEYRSQDGSYLEQKIFELTQEGTHINGSFSYQETYQENGSPVGCPLQRINVHGTTESNDRATVYLENRVLQCSFGYFEIPYPFYLRLMNNGNTLFIENWETELERTR